MPRPKAERNSSDLEAEIALLEQERKRLIEAEDQRRGAILRDLLSGSAGNALRTILQPLVPGRDAFLFGLEVSNGKKADAAPARRSAPPSVESSSQLTIEAETSSNRAS
jgi:hypothetical protein